MHILSDLPPLATTNSSGSHLWMGLKDGYGPDHILWFPFRLYIARLSHLPSVGFMGNRGIKKRFSIFHRKCDVVMNLIGSMLIFLNITFGHIPDYHSSRPRSKLRGILTLNFRLRAYMQNLVGLLKFHLADITKLTELLIY
jgi:hypothetical protein